MHHRTQTAALHREQATTSSYNGWPNRTTWLVNLHLTNDQGLDTEVRELVASALPNAERQAREVWNEQTSPGLFPGALPEMRERHVRSLVGDELRSYVADLAAFDPSSDHVGERPANLLALDLIGQALADVEWNRIAEHYIDDVREASQSAYGERSACQACGTDIEYVGDGWWDHGGNYSCDVAGSHCPPEVDR